MPGFRSAAHCSIYGHLHDNIFQVSDEIGTFLQSRCCHIIAPLYKLIRVSVKMESGGLSCLLFFCSIISSMSFCSRPAILSIGRAEKGSSIMILHMRCRVDGSTFLQRTSQAHAVEFEAPPGAQMLDDVQQQETLFQNLAENSSSSQGSTESECCCHKTLAGPTWTWPGRLADAGGAIFTWEAIHCPWTHLQLHVILTGIPSSRRSASAAVTGL